MRNRLVLGVELAKHAAIFAGPTFDLLVLASGESLPARAWLPSGAFHAPNHTLPWQLGLAAGVRF